MPTDVDPAPGSVTQSSTLAVPTSAPSMLIGTAYSSATRNTKVVASVST